MLPVLGSEDMGIYDAASGVWVNQKFQRLAELVHDFDPTLELQWIPPENRASDSTRRPFRIIQQHESIEPYVVMYIAEDQMDERVLAALFDARDNADGHVGTLATKLENAQAAAEIMELKKRNDKRDEMRDKARFLLRTPLHTPTMDGKRFRL